MKNDENKDILEYYKGLFEEGGRAEEISEFDKELLGEFKNFFSILTAILNFFVRFKSIVITPLIRPVGICRKIFSWIFWIFFIAMYLLLLFVLILLLFILFFPIILFKNISRFRFNKNSSLFIFLKDIRLKKLIELFSEIIKPAINHMVFKYIRTTAGQYFNGLISFEKAQMRVKNKLKLASFGYLDELSLINDLKFYLNSNAIVIYYCCALLHDKLKFNANRFELHVLWIKSALITGFSNDAEIVIKKSLSSNEYNISKSQRTELLHYYAFLLVQNDRNAEAIDYLDQVIELYQCNEENVYELHFPLIDAYGLRGVAHRNKGTLDEAINDFSKAIYLITAPSYKENYTKLDDCINMWVFSRNAFNLAITYHDKSDYRNALKYYHLVLTKPRDVALKSLFNRILNFSQVFKGAVAQMIGKSIISNKNAYLNHTNIEAFVNGYIGWILFSHNDLNSAITHLKVAMRISEENADIHGKRLWNYYLGVIYEEKSEFEIAYKYYEKSVDLLEFLRHEYKANNFVTAFDLVERGFHNRYFWEWKVSASSWASIERLAVMPKTPCTKSPYGNISDVE